ncbi:hypothetical protein LW135_06575 [Helicobacter sp. faydin-H20]|uniref:hypothetical protein n=1 Tax=Helicobacter anatolicus TaxID=2905874 RepID=UPI001E55CAD5|nr:hypothetical protein [Helicobacter anatolicus]MCE3037484.1 hypothetical protein [Helicobacter anatolicus]
MYGEARIYFGEIVEVKGNFAKIIHNGIRTDFYPYLQKNNNFKKCCTPLAIGQKVALIKSDESGVIIGDFLDEDEIFSDHAEHVIFNDGTHFKYKDGVLELLVAKELKIKCEKVKVEAKKVEIKSEEINLGGDGGLGVVTGECICPFTGSPHSDFSKKVKALK